MSTPHRIVNPETLPAPKGFAHAVVAAQGRTVYLGGQTAQRPDGNIGGTTIVEQYDQAAANVVEALRAAGGTPQHLVSMQIFVTDADEYRRSLRALGEVHRRHFGAHYPATALFEVKGLFDPAATVELMCIAVVPA
jgi:enamine deaminase RidA (YjgF/YER057c/UK114 family)